MYAPTQRVPAWKRLGLKLKGPASGDDPASSPSSGNASGTPNHSTQASQNGRQSLNASPASALKRKQQGSVQTPNKRFRPDEQQTPATNESTLRRQKSVTFAEDTKETVKPKPAKAKKPKKKEKTPKKIPEAPGPEFSLEPALSYLRQWDTDRESWKFNKNHQTLLIKYLFDANKVPSSDISVFYRYIRDLKGAVRSRLRETAEEIKKKDMEEGVAAFPSSMKDKETRQKEYEAAISAFLQQKHQANGGGSSSTNANGKRTFDEVELVLRIATPEVKQRLLKRIRAEMVLDELSDSESTTSTDTTTTTTTSSAMSLSSDFGRREVAAAPTGGSDESRAAVKTNDGPQQPAKRRRLRNRRTGIDDDDSSSDESSSDEDSDSSDDDEEEERDTLDDADDSSSSSSSDDDSDDSDGDMVIIPSDIGDGNESSSSSSSSSSSGSDSESAVTDDENNSASESSDDSDDE
ncbi:hypothetical protein B0H66DRAFT_549744 [Apodospora peruviana]|uniref:WKF domain-containing protein n=1 Tax=Apodospora peruviana TaxID=516989 RepID=A0AAE0MB11_9PEZI|nr:hypothetical protein B0H66DRAFT_549744 [Apodospora peruviana]